jgi:hypothetical protein
MIFHKFVDEAHAWWERYLRLMYQDINSGKVDLKGMRVFFPNILLVSKFPGYFSVELIGATKNFDGLGIKRHEGDSVYRYLGNFDDGDSDPVFNGGGENSLVSGLTVGHEVDRESLKHRFPYIDLKSSVLSRVGGRGSVFLFGDDFVSCGFENCVVVNKKNSLFRCKNILAAYIFSSKATSKQVTSLFECSVRSGDIKAVHVVKENEERLQIAGHLQSMALLPGLRETTIGHFINLHPDIVKIVFKTESFLYEKSFDWLEHDGTCEDSSINPDLLVKRVDGFYDIYDLKTAALHRKSITKGGRARRRFVDYVEEGVAQLVNYREYFRYEKNADFAEKTYGVKVKNPRLVLIVGSWENVSLDEVNQACRRYPDVSIIDYDTLCQIFVGAP